MRKTVKKYIGAHEGNDYTPHILRGTSILVALFLLLGMFAIYIFSPQLIFINKSSSAVYTSFLVDLTNKERIEIGEEPLEISTRLTKAAELKAQDMVAKGYFAHNSPQGVTPWYWFGKADYAFKYAGENLAIDFNDSDKVVEAWMNSPKHRANILNEKFTQMGIAFVKGSWEGRNTIYVVQMFGTPDLTVPALATAINNQPQAYAVSASPNTPAVLLQSGSNVQGASSDDAIKIIAETPTYIAVQSAYADQPQAIKPATTALQTPPQDESISVSGFIAKYILQPSYVLQTVYVLVAALILSALCCALYYERKNKEATHIIYGFLVLATVIILFAFAQTYFSPFVLIK
ncbi:MAG: CAP domain-containing protein [Patescibacteria group bacterium]